MKDRLYFDLAKHACAYGVKNIGFSYLINSLSLSNALWN